MVPIFFVVGLINIFSQHHNYGINIEDPNFDIRVRRSIGNTAKPQELSLNNNVENYFKTDVLKREKRYAYYKKTRITNNDLYRFNNTQGNNNNESQSRNGNLYDIFSPNWNLVFNATKNNNNNSRVNNGFINNNRPIIRSYPYGYPPGYGPKTNAPTGTDGLATHEYGPKTNAPTGTDGLATPGYRNQNNNNTPYFYNYQNPEGQNFAGYVGYAANNSANNNIPVPYAPRYSPKPNNTYINNYPLRNNPLAPYTPNYTQNPVANTANNGFPTANNINNNSGIQNLPYAPANGVYNNNFNSIPTPFNKDNLSPYAPNFNTGSATPNNSFVPYSPANYTFMPYFPANNTFMPYSSANNTFVPYSPANNTFVPYSPANNTYVTPSNNTNVTPSNVNLTVTTTEKMTIATSCVICHIPCPQFMRRFGRFCVPDDADDDY